MSTLDLVAARSERTPTSELRAGIIRFNFLLVRKGCAPGMCRTPSFEKIMPCRQWIPR